MSREAYKELSEKEHQFQKQVLKLSEENIELKFEVEQARKDIPRLKVCRSLSLSIIQLITLFTNTPRNPTVWDW